MKLGIIHISDFHIKSEAKFLDKKIEAFISAVRSVDEADGFLLVFSGDLAFSGKEEEYKKSRYLIGKILAQLQKIKQTNLAIIPGNHDLDLGNNKRGFDEIQKWFEDGITEEIMEKELSLFDNFYKVSHANRTKDRLVEKTIFSYDDKRIQVNLLNTAMFSTLKPNDKEMHYLPVDKIDQIKRDSKVSLCLTVMHHTTEWFNYSCKTSLEKMIATNSEFVLSGHDHIKNTKSYSIGNSSLTEQSLAGEMDFSRYDFNDSFNYLLIDIDFNRYNLYSFNWNKDSFVFVKKKEVDNKTYSKKSGIITPNSEYLLEIDHGLTVNGVNIDGYFVFPKMVFESGTEYADRNEIQSYDEFFNDIKGLKEVVIMGDSRSGKTTLLKQIYKKTIGEKVPLFYSASVGENINQKRFIKQQFKQQYGDDETLYSIFEQLDKSKKIMIFDNWDLLKDGENKSQLFEDIHNSFDTVIISVSEKHRSILNYIRTKFDLDGSYKEYSIKPFFLVNRTTLIRNVCYANGLVNEAEIDAIGSIINSVVKNNTQLFSLKPEYIIDYTDYLIHERKYDYSGGETILFSKVFEYQILKAIQEETKDKALDETIAVLEELAGYMFDWKKELINMEEFKEVIYKYNDEYSFNIHPLTLLDNLLKANVVSQTEDLMIKFSNRNNYAYFLAKHLLKKWNIERNNEGIRYLLKYICFGINSDILLFILYLAQDITTVQLISEMSKSLLSEWEELNYDSNNIKLLRNGTVETIQAPTPQDKNKLESAQEKQEENLYKKNELVVSSVFDYSEMDIDKQTNQIACAIKYTEMICKSLPAFNTIIKNSIKSELIEYIFSNPLKILYATLKPIDDSFDNLVHSLYEEIQNSEISSFKKGGLEERDVANALSEILNIFVLGVLDHFMQLCTNSRTISQLSAYTEEKVYNRIQKLLIRANSNNNSAFFEYASALFDESKDKRIQNIVRKIVRKYLLTNNVQHDISVRMINKFFPGPEKKRLLIDINRK